MSVTRNNSGSANIDKRFMYPSQYTPATSIAIAGYSSAVESFIELGSVLRIYAKQGAWVQINTLYPLAAK